MTTDSPVFSTSPAVIDRRFYEVVSCQASIFKTAAFLKHVGLSI